MTTTQRESTEAMVKRRIVADLKAHTVTVRHCDGLYRHYRCQKPGTWNMGFDVVTWPGSLCYTGDMGEYLFQRTEDMIAFMRGSCMSYSYAAEKCVAHSEPLKEWSEALFREALAERKREGKEYTVWRQGSSRAESVAEAIDVILQEYSTYSLRSDAEKAMHESGLWDELPNCEQYTHRFLWCLHAMEWFCGKVEKAEVTS